MSRELLTLVVPLLLPTVLYLMWFRVMRRPEADGAVEWRALPWMWLAVSGVALAALLLFVVTVHYGISTPGVYVPPRDENGRIVPGHIVPGPIGEGPIEPGRTVPGQNVPSQIVPGKL
jgi:Family of unknown function (DUF6111)